MRRSALVLVATLAVGACRSPVFYSTDGPAIALTITSSDVVVAQGEAMLVGVNVSRSGGFGGDVILLVDSVPTGLRVLTSSIQTQDGITSALLAVGADTGFATGTYVIKVRARASGVVDAIGSLTVRVAQLGSSAFSLEVRPVSVVQGSSNTAMLNIIRSIQFLGVTVSLSPDMVPPGVTLTIYPPDNANEYSTLTVAVDRSVTPGLYAFSLRGSSPGFADRVVTVPLTVLPSAP